MKRQVARTIAVALLLSVATGGAASAADMAVKASAIMPSAAVYNWTGWYAGVNGGWAFEGNTTGRLVSADPLFNAVLAVGGTPTFFGVKHEGGFGGGQVGYNWQMANWLVGVEADIQGADIGRTSTLAFPGTTAGIAPSVSTARDYIAWFGTLRGRVGLPVGPALLYATGGRLRRCQNHGHQFLCACNGQLRWQRQQHAGGMGGRRRRRMGLCPQLDVAWRVSAPRSRSVERHHGRSGGSPRRGRDLWLQPRDGRRPCRRELSLRSNIRRREVLILPAHNP